ncbi:spore coat protein YutH [Fredinandcohnia sp. QZ13]|uniref:spore coat putative kinase YutH n=1 Tax=Fredinandcohnia sp. QZ13 TaxID=3073144 RepID=UPI002853558B|nr:spore coat protein YutH [Fredinandcohnia sp. QZ13]MDR4889420.1 spore coat protein YutH [Fredinandcohnia sp. QZ13]
MKDILNERYKIKVDRFIKAFGYDAIIYRNIIYCIVPIPYVEQEELYEIKHLSDYMIQKGDIRVGSILPTTDGNLSTTIHDEEVVLIRIPVYSHRITNTVGYELARFHNRGRSFPYRVNKVNRIGQWKFLWERRLDQMELFWKEKVKQHPQNRFESLFVEAFPYYIGLTENAIQYLVDTEMDETPSAIDSATICHHRFSEMAWDKESFTKLPTDWVFDHCTRDLAEFIRDQYASGETRQNGQILHFMKEYERVSPLSPFSWRLLYARLLFPLHFFECIEGYYMTESENKKEIQLQRLDSMLKHSSDHERFLATFLSNVGVERKRLTIPNISWLQNKNI